jgi:hypothetical protein
MRLSHDPWVGVDVKVNARSVRGKLVRGLARNMGGMVVKEELNRGVGDKRH